MNSNNLGALLQILVALRVRMQSQKFKEIIQEKAIDM